MRPSRPAHRQLRTAQVAAAGGSTLLAFAIMSLVGTLVWGPSLTSTGNESALPTGSPAPSEPTPDVSPPVSPTTRPPAAPTPTRPQATLKPAKTITRPAPPPALDGNTGFEGTVLTLVNKERAKVGCASLTRDSRLAKAARAHSADMASRNYFDHTTPEGVTFDKRIINAGYRYSRAAENIAAGQSSPASVMDTWMNSSGHRANILNCKLKHLGVGLIYSARGRPYWTQDFGTPL
ncbi:CAP domain-containing protein [Luedemannella flava]|uniref:CAP domain-containing protein n=1 Tax=Luedemannella flava TaxID=349316 RepID=A0ABP4Y043_9ACTN